MIYKWEITAIDTAVNENGFENIVKVIHWRYKLTNENNVSFETYGSMSLPSPNELFYIHLDEINQDILITWLEGNIDMIELKERVDLGLLEIIQPKIINVPFKMDETI